MERREDFRHGKQYRLTLKCARTRRVIDDLVTEDVSASGLRLVSDVPHDLEQGDLIEIRLYARVSARESFDTLVMATDAKVVRASQVTAALSFNAPLAY